MMATNNKYDDGTILILSKFKKRRSRQSPTIYFEQKYLVKCQQPKWKDICTVHGVTPW